MFVKCSENKLCTIKRFLGHVLVLVIFCSILSHINMKRLKNSKLLRSSRSLQKWERKVTMETWKLE